MVVGSLAHLKHVLVFLFVKGHLEIVEDDIPTSVVLGRGLERLIAQFDPSKHGTAHRQ